MRIPRFSTISKNNNALNVFFNCFSLWTNFQSLFSHHSGIHCCWSSARPWRRAPAAASTPYCATFIEMDTTASAGTAIMRPHWALNPPLPLWVWVTPECSASARILYRSEDNKNVFLTWLYFSCPSVSLYVCVHLGGRGWLHLRGAYSGSSQSRHTSSDVRSHTRWLAGRLNQSAAGVQAGA